MFFHMAGGGPFGEFGGIVFASVLDDSVQNVQRDGGFVRGVFQSAGGSGLRTGSGAFGGDDGFKGGDVRIEMRDEVGGEAKADEWRGEGGGVGGKGAGGVEQGLVATAAGQEKFSVESGSAEQDEGMDGVGDAHEVVMQMEPAGNFGEHGSVGLLDAGNLRGTESGGEANGGVDEGELLSAKAGDRIIGGVFDAKGVNGFQGGKEAVYFLFHNGCFTV